MSSEVIEARRENLPLMSRVVNPGVPRSTRNPRMLSGVLAQTMATSAMLPLVIQRLVPLRMKSVPSGRARVSMLPGSDP